MALAALLLSARLAGAGLWEELRVGTGARPHVSGSTVVWTDYYWSRYVRVADVSDPDHLAFSSIRAFGSANGPRISGDYVVWQDWAYGSENIDIAAVDLTDPNREPFLVATDPNAEERWPDIDGDRVVWTAWGTTVPGVWLGYARLADGAVASTYTMRPFNDLPLSPRISGDLVVWHEDNTGDSLGANVADPNNPVVFEVGAAATGVHKAEKDCGISGQWAIWNTSNPGSGSILYADNLFDPYPPLLLTDSSVRRADIAENIVVWAETRDWNTDIYGYNLATGVEFRITDDEARQDFPAISADPQRGRFVVVWVDERAGKDEVYGAILDGPTVAGCVSFAPGDLNRDCRVDGLDFALLAADWLASSEVASPFESPEDTDGDDTEEPDEHDDVTPRRSRQ